MGGDGQGGGNRRQKAKQYGRETSFSYMKRQAIENIIEFLDYVTLRNIKITFILKLHQAETGFHGAKNHQPCDGTKELNWILCNVK